MVNFERTDPIDWDARIDFIIETAPAWITILAPLVEMCLKFITADPLGTTNEPRPDWIPKEWKWPV